MNIARTRLSCSRAALRASTIALALALSACGPEEVTLVRYGSDAQLPPDNADADAGADAAEGFDAGTVSDPHADASSELDARTRPDLDASTAARSCTGNEDCTSRELCAMSSCNAKKGTCVATPPFFCNGEQSPICGCDGLVYFNDCLRQEARVNVDVGCLMKRSCSSTQPCPGLTSCSYLFKGDRTCRQAAPIRECWVLPILCSSALGGAGFAPCDVASTACVGLCEAIAQETPFTELSSRCGRPPGSVPSNISYTP